MLGHKTAHAFIENMGVNLGRRNIRMTQHLLDAAQISIMVQKMGRKGMAQHMRADLARIQPCGQRQTLEQLEKPLAAERFASATGEKMW